jgi:hypothetical protein
LDRCINDNPFVQHSVKNTDQIVRVGDERSHLSRMPAHHTAKSLLFGRLL